METENVLQSLTDGFHFIWKTKIVLWAISLDLVSVLFGGVIALLPIFAEEILKVGPEGLGYLRAAPSIGALITMIVLTKFPPMHHAWRNMLLAVAGFGIFTILFAFSNKRKIQDLFFRKQYINRLRNQSAIKREHKRTVAKDTRI
jgi:hypothetical protein